MLNDPVNNLDLTGQERGYRGLGDFKDPKRLDDFAKALRDLGKEQMNPKLSPSALSALGRFLSRLFGPLVSLAIPGMPLNPSPLSDPMRGPDGNWYWPDGTPVEIKILPCHDKKPGSFNKFRNGLGG